MAVAFTFQKLWWLGFFGIIPLFYAAEKTKELRNLFKLTLLFSLSFYVPLLFWLYELEPDLPLGWFNYPALSLVILFLAIMQGVYLATSLCVFTNIKKNSVIDIFTFSALYILGEWIQEIIPFLPFPWARIGVCMSKFLPFIQSASLFGSLFTSFLVIAINCSLCLIIINIKNHIKLIPIVTTLVIIFIGNISYGVERLNMKENDSHEFEVALIQGNYAGGKKWSSSADDMLFEYIALTKKATTSKTKLVIWPETAIPLYLGDSVDEKQALIRLAKEKNITLIIGVLHKTFEPNNTYNSMVAISPNGEISEPYNKQILVPFGEKIPFEKFLKSVTTVLANFSSFSAGDGSSPIKTSIAKVGGVICYESIFPQISRKSVQNGAEIIALISNDSWFNSSPALYQHHAHAIMRAVENKRYVLRTTNTGVTSIISPDGEVLSTAKTFVRTTLVGDVSLKNGLTLYSYIGDVFVLFGISAFVFGLIETIRTKIRK